MKNSSLLASLAAGICAGLCTLTPAAKAETIFGLSNNDNAFYNLVSFDSAAPGTTLSNVSITGVTGVLSSIDFRPSNGQLYGVSYQLGDGATSAPTAQLYAINTTTGVATAVGSAFTLSGATSVSVTVGIDFNPVVDRLRIVASSSGAGTTSYRLNPDTAALTVDTALAFAAGDPNAGQTPSVKGIAYSNNFAGATMTTLYAYEYRRDVVATIGSPNGMPISPNSGQMFTLGSSGIITDGFDVGFDISSLSGLGFIAAIDEEGEAMDGDRPFAGFRHLLPGMNDPLYSVNLATGELTFLGGFDSSLFITDIAVAIPEPGTLTLGGVGLAALGIAAVRRARRRPVMATN